MKILITGAKGFVGRNLCANLYNIKEGKDRTRPDIHIEDVFEYDIDTDPSLLDEYCAKADFVFNLAGVNRPKEQSEFMEGNFGFASTLIDTLKKHANKCPVMLSSSQQASLTGRFGNSEYGRSKKAGEDLFLKYGEDNGVKVLVYRFPNLFGKWCRPNYNSAVATFCHNIANDLPIQVNDPSVELELLYIDDLINEMFDALEGKEHRCEFEGLEVIPTANGQRLMANSLQLSANGQQLMANGLQLSANGQRLMANSLQLSANGQQLMANGKYCYCPVTHKVTLGEIVELLHTFKELPNSLTIPEIPSNSFAKKLFSTYLSYLPKEKAIFDLKMNVDARGSFTELVHTLNCGQVSINISKPGITKGQHWHNSKWEQFIVVKGHGLIQMRKEDDKMSEVRSQKSEVGCEGKNENISPSIRRGAEGGVVTQTSRRSRYNENENILEFEVSGDKIQSVIMLPGYTHNIINLSDTEDLVTVMYCNEVFDPNRPDTFFDPVE